MTGILKPDDDTIKSLNIELAKPQVGYYIWRTVEDDHVRPEHAKLNGAIRSWGEHPLPGEDFGCRCWLERITHRLTEDKAIPKWNDLDFVAHYFTGKGKTVDLKEVGIIDDIITKSNKMIVPKIKEQISDIAKKTKDNQLNYKTENFYSFKDKLFSLGKSTVKTVTNGNIHQKGDNIIINGSIKFYLTDEFSDPSTLREIVTGSSAMSQSKILNYATEPFGTPYKIKGSWESPLTIKIKKTD